VDLFCGAGGLTHGLRAAGVPVVAGVDLDSACKHPYEANNGGAKFYARDVAKLEAAEVSRWLGKAKVRVLAGCAPCQPFSTYAQRYERKEDQWALLRHFARLVEEVEPEIVTMENVPTVIKHQVFDDFVSTLKGKGYEVWFAVVDSSAYGLPQRRRRTVLIASRQGLVKLRAPDGSDPKTVEDALIGLSVLQHGAADPDDPLHTASRLSPLNLKRIRASKPGGTWRDWPKQLVAACHRKDTGKSYPGVYGRMSWDDPAPTLTTQFFGFGNGRFGHPEEDRGLSLREGAILQGFPKDYSFALPGERIQFKLLGRLIGNAVPVDLGRAIGESIVGHIQATSRAKPTRRGKRRGQERESSATHIA
jgi:DNA (cytosine-5)-methyltransferase 1